MGGPRDQSVRLGAALEFDQKEDGLHKFHFLVVGERDDHLVVFLGHDQVLGADGRDRVLDLLLPFEGGTNPTITAQNRRPNRVTPRWRLDLWTRPIIRPPRPLLPATGARSSGTTRSASGRRNSSR